MLADRDGLEAVTMRRLAEALGVGPVALYTYVPGKAELLDLMLDRAYAEMDRSAPAGAGWRAGDRGRARQPRAVRGAPVGGGGATGRPPLGPGLMAKYEYELGALAGLGLGDVARDAALNFVLGFVRRPGRGRGGGRVGAESGMSDEQWWAANAPLLERMFDPARIRSRRGWGRRPVPPRAAATAPSTRRRSAWSGCSTASGRWSSGAPRTRSSAG